MLMETPAQTCANLTAAPGEVTYWLHQLRTFTQEMLPAEEVAVVGPHTFSQVTLAPFETAGLYVVSRRQIHEIPARRIAVGITYLPLHQPGIGLNLRVWSSFPATLDTLVTHLCSHFAQANPVLSSVVRLLFATPLLACNRWLYDRLDADASTPRDYYTPWLEQYRCLRGSYPADSRRSFRAAVSAWRQSRAAE
jgi:hypothetical protein